jgi:hypothetical protein
MHCLQDIQFIISFFVNISDKISYNFNAFSGSLTVRCFLFHISLFFHPFSMDWLICYDILIHIGNLSKVR